MKSPVKMLVVFVNESDRAQEGPLYEMVVQRLRQLDVAGATAHVGMMGFGRHHRLHHKGLFGIADDRPITILAVDEEPKLRAAVAALGALVGDRLALLVDAELLTSA